VQGKVTDTQGRQGQALTSGAVPGLGGSGTAAAATKVRAQMVGADGTLSVLAEAQVEAGGSYSFNLPEGSERVVVEAVDAEGKVVAAALLDATAEHQGGVRSVAPISSETSLEAQVFVQLVKEGVAPESVDTVDLRSRIDATLGAQVAAGQADAEATEKRVVALARAVRAAQEAEVRALAEAGTTVTQAQLFEASLAAASRLDASLHGGDTELAWQLFFEELREATPELDEKEEAEGERAASAAFRATVEVELGADSAPVLEAATRSAARVEAYAANAAVHAVLKAAGATQAVLDAAVEAGAALHAGIDAAADAEAVAQAYAAWNTEVAAGGSASVLGSFVEADAGGQLALQTALTATAAAGATLDVALGAAVETALVTGGSVDVAKLSESMVDAFAAYHAAVRAQAQALSALGARAAPAAEVMLVAEGSFRLQ
jgi:hypothetical protein